MMPAREPGRIPYRFAAAWNRGDAEGIAQLFAPDADFVNVHFEFTGEIPAGELLVLTHVQAGDP